MILRELRDVWAYTRSSGASFTAPPPAHPFCLFSRLCCLKCKARGYGARAHTALFTTRHESGKIVNVWNPPPLADHGVASSLDKCAKKTLGFPPPFQPPLRLPTPTTLKGVVALTFTLGVHINPLVKSPYASELTVVFLTRADDSKLTAN